MFCNTLVCIDDVNPKGAALNMATDEALLRLLEFGCPTLRHYRWRHPSVSLGYFTPYAAVPARYAGWDLVRRWTGGGIVEHQGDFTYSLLLPATHPLQPAAAIYEAVHAALAVTLRAHGLAVNQLRDPDPVVSESCFERAVQADLKVGRAKVAGAAMRKHRKGVLLQGSVQGVPIPNGMLMEFAAALTKNVSTGQLTDAVLETANILAHEKYDTAAWNRRF